jgi:hypothetical protein
MAHFGLDPGRGFVQWIGGEYTGQLRDTYSTQAAVKGHVSIDDYNQMKRILLNRCPAQLNFEEPLSKTKVIQKASTPTPPWSLKQ